MNSQLFEVESARLFSKSKIWQLNRDYYNFRGISAFNEGTVPHNLTSSAFVGKTYAELIFGFLKDLGTKGKTSDKVYILELGAGHGRLAFHILTQLQRLIEKSDLKLPPYCYVLSDIVEENLSFFRNHPQFETFIKKGILDTCHYEAIGKQNLELVYSKKTVGLDYLNQPLIAIANYFFDSIPNELFRIKDQKISSCSISLQTTKDPKDLDPEELIENLELSYSTNLLEASFYENKMVNSILDNYKDQLKQSYICFPEKAMQCINNLKNLSKSGLLLLTMDKGFHNLHDLKNKPEPEFINHGSLSIWVNYHALGCYCDEQDGKVLFPNTSSFHLVLASLMFLKNCDSYKETIAAYQKSVLDFGPDDFNSIKQLSYLNVSSLKTKELIALYRMSAYDSTFFTRFMPRLKQVAKTITFNERTKIAETMHHVWDMYFNIGEAYDLAYEMAGIFYDLGLYTDALKYFNRSIDSKGQKPDTLYNIALSYYQLREDDNFYKTLKEAKLLFPKYEQLKQLDDLDMG